MKHKTLSGSGGADGGGMNEQEEMVLKNSLTVAEKKVAEYEEKVKAWDKEKEKLEAEKDKFEKRYVPLTRPHVHAVCMTMSSL